MNVQKTPIYQFLEGAGKSFVIPVYQRDYAWTIPNCQKLWDDIVFMETNKKQGHFLGTIVTIANDFQEYLVIDGQQRLTSTSLLLLALHNFLKTKKNKSPQEASLTEQVLDFLINKYSQDQSKRIRLKPNKGDKDFYEQLYDGGLNNLVDSNINTNYNYFYKQIEKNILSPIELFQLFQKLEIVLISLDRGVDDPQLIFESLNSTGVDLNDGDLIRNYILMDLPPQMQENLYASYWVKIENCVNDVAEFVRVFLMYRNQENVRKTNREIYSEFRLYCEDKFAKNPEKTLMEMLEFAQLYSYFICTTKFPNAKIGIALNRIFKLEATIVYPYMLDLFYDYKKGLVSGDVLLKVLTLIESYVFRKVIVDGTTQGLNKFFLTLGKDIKKDKNWQTKYLDIFCSILINRSFTQKFPTDEDFTMALQEKEVYKYQSKNRNLLLHSLENHNSAYKIDSDDLTVEHIMPQTLNNLWKEKLGSNWSEIHRKYLHTLGNLSLTAKNAELANSDFETKQKIDFQSSKLKLNYDLGGKVWNEKSIVTRANNLAKEALQIWPYPITKIVSQIVENEIYDLESEFNPTNKKPVKFYFGNESMEVKAWKDLLTIMSSYFYIQSPTEFKALITSPKFFKYFSFEGNNRTLKSPIKFAAGYYIEGNKSSSDIILIISKMCDFMKFDKSKVQVEVE
jgi:uncharacterized protein with ParB-like and HNH nuclease domain